VESRKKEPFISAKEPFWDVFSVLGIRFAVKGVCCVFLHKKPTFLRPLGGLSGLGLRFRC